MLWAYLCGLFRCVVRPGFSRRDAVGFIFGMAIPLTAWQLRDEVIESAIDVLDWQLLAGLIVVLLLRAIAAPYVIWKEQIAYISELRQELDDPPPREAGGPVRQERNLPPSS
jgi:hypothetical protein